MHWPCQITVLIAAWHKLRASAVSDGAWLLRRRNCAYFLTTTDWFLGEMSFFGSSFLSGLSSCQQPITCHHKSWMALPAPCEIDGLITGQKRNVATRYPRRSNINPRRFKIGLY